MSHFGVLSYKGVGHLNPLIALSKQLMSRGNRVTFFQEPDLEDRVRQQGLGFYPLGSIISSEARSQTNNQRGNTAGITALRLGIKRIVNDMERSLLEAPGALTKAGVDALIIDEIVISGPTLAQMLYLPYFLVSTSVPHNFGWHVPRRLSGHSYPASCISRWQNMFLQVSALRVWGPVRGKLDRFRRQVGLGTIREIHKVFPELAHITQLPQCLDFPRSTLPANFYYTGPFVDESARPVTDFPWSRLDGRPLIYASLGTRKNSEHSIFRVISTACHELDLQLVISLGGRVGLEMFADLPGQPLVVRYAPQLELLKRAEVTITHGGLNTVLETLMEGKPMIILPMVHDQPAVAARLARLKVAEVLPVKDLSAKHLQLALVKIRNDSSYCDAAAKMQTKIRSACGVQHAADLIEEAIKKYASGRPVN